MSPQGKPVLLRVAFSVLALVVTFVGSGCSTSQRVGSWSDPWGYERSESGPENRALEDIISQYKQRNFSALIVRTKAFLSRYPTSSLLPYVRNYRALAFLFTNSLPNALVNFEYVVRTTSNDYLKSQALYNKAYVELELKKTDQAAETLLLVHPEALSPQERFRLYSLGAKVARERKDFYYETKHILEASRYGSPQNKSQLAGELKTSLSQIYDLSILDRLIAEYETLELGSDVIVYAAHLAKTQSLKSKERSYWDLLLKNYPTDSRKAEASERMSSLDKRGLEVEASPHKLGVLLTLSGPLGRYGQKISEGIQAALLREPEYRRFQVIVQDDQGTPEGARQGFDLLARQHQVIAIIGPFSSKLIEGVSNLASEYQVPVLALTQKEGRGDYVFNLGLTPQAQTHALIDYAKNQQGLQKFVIMAPANRFGDEYTQEFTNELQKNDLTLVNTKRYPEAETDFRKTVDELVHLDKPAERAAELEELQLRMSLKNKTAGTTGSRPGNRRTQKIQLPPIVEFDAVFIPDEPRSVGQILPTFAYRDVDHMKYLGLSSWNSEELVARAGTYGEGAYFVDTYAPSLDTLEAREFRENMNREYHRDPSSIEALGYDGALVALSLLKRDSSLSSHSELKNALSSFRGISTVSGEFSGNDGKIHRPFHVLTIHHGAIVPAE